MSVKGVGRYQIDASRDSEITILEALRKGEWIRYNEIVTGTGLSSATVSKHLKRLEKEGYVEKRIDLESGEYPYPVSYRISSRGKRGSVKLQIIEDIEGLSLLQITDESELPEYRLLLSTKDVGDLLSKRDRWEIDKLLTEMEFIFVKVQGIIDSVYGDSVFEGFPEGDREKIEYFYRYEPHHHSLESRYLASGVASSRREPRVQREEEEELRRFGVTHADVDDDPHPFVIMNRELKQRPLTRWGYQKFLELDKRIKEAEPVVNEVLMKSRKSPPQVCAVLYSMGLEDMFSRYKS